VYPNGTYAIDGDDVRQGTLTPTKTPTPTLSPTVTGTTPPPAGGAEDVPGFGPGIALVALAVFAVLARRRR
jgi:PGF-CTERM protein